jgi:hypothetical protein
MRGAVAGGRAARTSPIVHDGSMDDYQWAMWDRMLERIAEPDPGLLDQIRRAIGDRPQR